MCEQPRQSQSLIRVRCTWSRSPRGTRQSFQKGPRGLADGLCAAEAMIKQGRADDAVVGLAVKQCFHTGNPTRAQEMYVALFSFVCMFATNDNNETIAPDFRSRTAVSECRASRHLVCVQELSALLWAPDSRGLHALPAACSSGQNLNTSLWTHLQPHSHGLRFFSLLHSLSGTTRHCTAVFLAPLDFAHRCAGALPWRCPAHLPSWQRSLSRTISCGFVDKSCNHRVTQTLLERGATRYV